MPRLWLSGVLACSLLPALAQALPPLDDFERAAQQRGFDNREQRALGVQRAAEAQKAWWALLPRVSATADYLRNQYNATATIPGANGAPGRTTVFTPKNQRDLTLTATLPLVDLSRVYSGKVATSVRAEQAAQVAQIELDVAKLVASTYYNLVASVGVLDAAQHALSVAEQNLDYVESRHGAGFANELDVLRAAAEVESDRQLVAEADYSQTTLARALATLSGLTPSELTSARYEDDLQPEAALDRWLMELEKTPSVLRAERAHDTAQERVNVQRVALLPSVSAQATERFSNAVGFNHSPYYSVGLVADWKLDATSYAGARAEQASAEQTRVRSERVLAELRDSVFNAWYDVKKQLVKGRAARAQASASSKAVEIAQQRFAAGTATQLELIQAQRDALNADVAMHQADAQLATARATLRLTSGHPLRRSAPSGARATNGEAP